MSAMEPPYAHTDKIPRGPLNTYLNWICKSWQLHSASKCIPRMISLDGEAEDWPIDLVRDLGDIARTTEGKRKAVIRDLLYVWHLRLRRYPESAPYLLAQDVKPVLKRHVFLARTWTVQFAPGQFEALTPKLNTIPTPPKWKTSRGNGTRAAPTPHAVVTPGQLNLVDIEQSLPPIPADRPPSLRLRALRRREIWERKERDLARTRYEIALLAIKNTQNMP